MPGPRDLERFQQQLDELFQDLWHVPRFAGLRRGFRPQVDSYRRGEPAELRVVVELPGVDPADVRIAIEGRDLLIAGVRRRPEADCRVSYHQLEIEYGPFQRRIALTEDVDSEAATAIYERGMLSIVLPIAPAAPAPEKVSIPVNART